jgi:alpha-L-fucosidase
MNVRVASLAVAAALSLAARAAPPTARPTRQQLAWQRMEMTMFCHFGVNTFTDREWGDGKEDPAIFNPSALDCRQWARAARDAGFRLMILTAKHHDGFCLWPSKHTEHSVTHSPWRGGKGDVVREFADACRAEGLALGLYLSPWDRHEATYGTDAYNDHFCRQLEELLTGYGPVAEVWFDGACGEGPNGKRQVYDFPRWYALIRKLQPDALIAICGPDIRWVGNESGVAREGESSVRENGTRWHPAECDVSIRPGWFHHAAEDARVKPLSHLMDIYFKSVGRNSGLLLNVPPDRRGLFADPDVTRLAEFGAATRALYATNLLAQGDTETAVDNDRDTRWATSDETRECWLEVDLQGEREIARCAIAEMDPRITKFRIEVRPSDDAPWQTALECGRAGQKFEASFPSVRARHARLHILDATFAPTIWEFELFGPAK